MLRRFVHTAFVVALLLLSASSVAQASPRMPYSTTIRCGEIMTARLTLGDVAAMCMAGRDAIPAFVNVRAYETYYRVDGDPQCDESCLRPLYREMRQNGSMRPLISGERVTVLGVFADPEDKRYKICRVKTTRGTWLVICDALAVAPGD